MEVIGFNKSPDWPKLGPSLLIATALVVAIRTARWTATSPGDALCADVDPELDKEVAFAARVTDRVLHLLLRKHPELFPQKREPICSPSEDESPA